MKPRALIAVASLSIAVAAGAPGASWAAPARPAGTSSSAAAPAGATAACSLTPTSGTVVRSIGSRSYRLRVPSGLTGTQVPLLLSMHGGFSNAQAQESQTGWSPFAGPNNFIVAYPEGSGTFFNPFPGSSDITFLRQVVADVSSRWCVDPRRVHADGHSVGAAMSQRLACEAADMFASVVSYAAGSPPGGCTTTRPIGVGLFYGEADGGISGGRTSRDEWVARNRCSTTPVREPVSEGTFERYTGCAGGVQVWWRTYPGQGHPWPTGARGADQRSRMWQFLQAHPRPV